MSYEGETVEVIIPEWLATKNGIPTKIVDVVKKETDKAIMFEYGGTDLWLPKSVITIK